MRWLFVCGLSLELAGAAVIAWTIYSRTRAETREEALTKFGANLWVIVFREREQAFVRAGLALLASGFLLQLVGYLTGFGSFWEGIAALFAAIAIFLVGLFGTRKLVERRAPFRYADDTELPSGIQDERHIYRVPTLDNVQVWRAMYASRILDTEVAHRSQHSALRINHGRWVFDCGVCGNSGMSTPGIASVLCENCVAEYPVVFPEDRPEIERLLLLRPELQNRNWAGESLEQLRQENREHGIKDPHEGAPAEDFGH